MSLSFLLFSFSIFVLGWLGCHHSCRLTDVFGSFALWHSPPHFTGRRTASLVGRTFSRGFPPGKMFFLRFPQVLARSPRTTRPCVRGSPLFSVSLSLLSLLYFSSHCLLTSSEIRLEQTRRQTDSHFLDGEPHQSSPQEKAVSFVFELCADSPLACSLCSA